MVLWLSAIGSRLSAAIDSFNSFSEEKLSFLKVLLFRSARVSAFQAGMCLLFRSAR
jgi:hypothetical protein